MSIHVTSPAGLAAADQPAVSDVSTGTSPAADLDVSGLPSFSFGNQSLLWWATMGMIAIEGTVFALTLATCFYLRSRTGHWPPTTRPPALIWGTLNTLVLLISMVPNHLVARAAKRLDRRAATLWTWVCVALSVLFLALRVLEFGALNVRWDTDAYGSAIWTLLGFHTAHLFTDTIDTIVLGVILLTGPFEQRRMVDIAENGSYWYFVVLAWVPVYLVIYWLPRF